MLHSLHKHYHNQHAMEPNNQPTPEQNEPAPNEVTAADNFTQQAPADALSRTPEDLNEAQASVNEQPIGKVDTAVDKPAVKKTSPFKQFFKKINVYILLFSLLLVVTATIAAVAYLNSQKAPKQPDIARQQLSTETLKQLANTDASVGDTAQTLTIQGNAIIAGQTLMRGDLNVAGNLQTGGNIQAPNLTISGTANLGDAQTNTLQVASNAAVQGSTTMRDLSVSGASTFSGAITASEITATRLILSGNATLVIPNHISFTGPSPRRDINASALGSGGSASINGSDTSGTVNINTGNNPTAGCMVQINFSQAFTNQPRVIVSPVGAAAGQTQYYVNRNQTSFNICAAAPAPANQTFAFDYFISN